MSNTVTHIKTDKQLVPALRFKEFERDWKKEPVGNHFDLMSGFAFKSDDISEDSSGVPILRGINITEGHIRHNEKIDRYFLGDTSKLDRLRVKVGDLVLGMDGSKVGKNSALVTENDAESLLIQRVARLREKKGSCLSFIYSHINSIRFHKYVDVVNTSSGIPHISSKQINNFKIFFPETLPEQQKIASFLSAVDEKIQQLTAKKNLLEQYKKGVMQKLFSGKIRFKDENGNDFPDWEEKRLGEVLTLGSGRDYKHLEKGNYPVYGTGGYMTKVNKYLYDGDSVGIGRKGTIDKPVFLQGKFWTVDTLFYTYSFIKVLPYYIYLLFQTINWKLYNEASGVPSLSKSTIIKLKFNFPSIKEQQKIATYLSSLDTKIETVNKRITQTQTFKKGLLQQMFV